MSEQHGYGAVPATATLGTAAADPWKPNYLISLLLAVFLGFTGAHRFYRRERFSGWLVAFLSVCAAVAVLVALTVSRGQDVQDLIIAVALVVVGITWIIQVLHALAPNVFDDLSSGFADLSVLWP